MYGEGQADAGSQDGGGFNPGYDNNPAAVNPYAYGAQNHGAQQHKMSIEMNGDRGRPQSVPAASQSSQDQQPPPPAGPPGGPSHLDVQLEYSMSNNEDEFQPQERGYQPRASYVASSYPDAAAQQPHQQQQHQQYDYGGYKQHGVPDMVPDQGSGGGGGLDFRQASERRHKPDHSRAESLRSIFSARDAYLESDWIDERSAQHKMKHLCCTILVAFIGVIVIIFCWESTQAKIIGVFGDVETVNWKYGWADQVIQTGANEVYIDTYTRPVAHDAGEYIAMACFLSILILSFVTLIICIRYNGDKPLYIKLCGIRIPQRATVAVLLDFVKSLYWGGVLFYLAATLYGFMEMNYYVTDNCAAGTCYPYIVPLQGWLCQLIVCFLLSCCGHQLVSKMDPPFLAETMRFYYPQHERAAKSPSPPIDLKKLKSALSYVRKIILNCLLIIFFKRSGLIFIAITTPDSSAANVVGIFQSVGYSNASDHPSISADDATSFSNTADMVYPATVWVIFVCIILHLYFNWAIVHFRNGSSIVKTFFLLVAAVNWCLWVYVFGMFYYEFYNYWSSNSGKSHVDTGVVTEVESIIWCPSWGLLFVILNTVWLAFVFWKGYKGL